jgi:hypothetical protein
MLEITDLPPQIVPAVNAFAQRLSSHIHTHREASLEVHEQGVLDAWRAEAAAMLGGVVRAATTGADPEARPPRSTCARCGQGRAAERWRRRTVETQLGGLTFTRTCYRRGMGHQRWTGADRTLGLRPRHRTSAGWPAGRRTWRHAARFVKRRSCLGSWPASRSGVRRCGPMLNGWEPSAKASCDGPWHRCR